MLKKIIAALILTAAVSGCASKPVATKTKTEPETYTQVCVSVAVNDECGFIVYDTVGEITPPWDYIALDGTKRGDVVITVCTVTEGTLDDVQKRDDYVVETLDETAFRSAIRDRNARHCGKKLANGGTDWLNIG